jgi:hypothetical protein
MFAAAVSHPEGASAIYHYTDRLLDSLAKLIAVEGYFYTIQSTIARLYGTINARTESGSLRDVASQHKATRDLNLQLDQMLFDLRHQLGSLTSLLNNGTVGFIEIEPGKSGAAEPLGSRFSSIVALGERLLKRTEFWRDANRDYLITRNTETTEVLLRRTLIVSVIVAITGFLAVFSTVATNWQAVKTLWNDGRNASTVQPVSSGNGARRPY